MKKIGFLFFVLQMILLSSCEDKIEYAANVSVINNAKTKVENFDFELEGVCFFKTIESLDTSDVETFTANWIGESWGIGGGMENRYPFIVITYSIDSSDFSVENEEGAQIDSYNNYYSEKTITKGDSAIITITDNGYKIEIIQTTKD